jgi:predicted ABC-class ATPase
MVTFDPRFICRPEECRQRIFRSISYLRRVSGRRKVLSEPHDTSARQRSRDEWSRSSRNERPRLSRRGERWRMSARDDEPDLAIEPCLIIIEKQ